MVINATLAIDNLDFGFNPGVGVGLGTGLGTGVGVGLGTGLGTGLGLTGFGCKYVCKNPIAAGI